MDYAEEQEMETQALEAIYGDEYKKCDDGGFDVTLVPESGAGEDVNHISVALHVAYTPTYPEAAPELSVKIVRRGGLTDEMVGECEQLLREAAGSEELLGTAMVYALADKCIEWLVEHNKPEMDMHQEMMERLKKAQEADDDGAVDVSEDGGAATSLRKGSKGGKGGKGGAEGTWRAEQGADAMAPDEVHTPVTPETFATFRKEWDVQRAAARANKLAGGSTARGRNVASADDGLSGRHLFERSGASLVDTDAGALDDGEEELMTTRDATASEPSDAAAAGGAEGGTASSAEPEAALLAAVGDADLFDEDEELPDDED
jgi:hypothetical protein